MFIFCKVKQLFLVTVLALSFLCCLPTDAQADVAIALDTAKSVVNLVTVYPKAPKKQSQILSDVSKTEAFASLSVAGFQGAAILKAQDSAQVIALSQWSVKDPSSLQFHAKENVLNIPAGQSVQSFTCQVQHTEARDASPNFHQGDVIMFSQFKMKPARQQSELATIISQMMPGVMQMIPGLQWAAMCPSIDESTIALLARWNSREDFESLGQNPGFDPETNYWQDYANNEHGLYDVVEVIR